MRPQWTVILLLLVQTLLAPAAWVRAEQAPGAAPANSAPCDGCRGHCPCRNQQTPACPCAPARPTTTPPSTDTPAIVQRTAVAQHAGQRRLASFVDALVWRVRGSHARRPALATGVAARAAPPRPALCVWQT